MSTISEHLILSGDNVTYRIDCEVDNDNHLNIYVSLPDDNDDSLRDTEGFPIVPYPGEELVYRTTTKKIEDAHNKEAA